MPLFIGDGRRDEARTDLNFNIDKRDGLPKINIKNSFCNHFNSAATQCGEDASFKDIFGTMDTAIKDEWAEILGTAPSPDLSKSLQGALNRAHGAWYEYIISIESWNYSVANDSFLLVNLPNKNGFSVHQLYTREFSGKIDDFKEKLQSVGADLITSNPDFAIVANPETRFEDERCTIDTESVSPRDIEALEELYRTFTGSLHLNDLKGFVSAKTSFRADRLFQMPHEASTMKALYIHLQTRDWIIDAPGIKYYSMAMGYGRKDTENLKTVATHSITTVQHRPEPVVDRLFKVDSIRSLHESFEAIDSDIAGSV